MPQRAWCMFLVRRVSFAALLCLFPGLILGQDSNAKAQGGGAELAALYTQGMAAFQSGNYPVAASTLEQLLNKAEFSVQLEPAYFTLGSAWFNVPDYKKAIAAFKAYQTKFPNGPHAGDAGFAVAQSNLLSKNYADAASQFAALEKHSTTRGRDRWCGEHTSRDGEELNKPTGSHQNVAGGDACGRLSVDRTIRQAHLKRKKKETNMTSTGRDQGFTAVESG